MAGKTLRLMLLAALALLALVASVTGAAAAPAAAASSSARSTISEPPGLEAAILVELNVVRRAHGLTPLRRSSQLAAAAATHTRAMARFGFFAHESRDGSSFSRRLGRFYRPQGYASWSVGENLLCAQQLDARDAVRLWMASPPHRRNILHPQWREVGLSAVLAARAPGDFGGLDVVIVTSDFGARS